MVEGYMDVIGVYAAGVRNVVASCGTALTNFQVRSLRRHASEVVLNFDPDNAGANAAEKSIPILLEEGVRLRVLSLTSGLDPDEYIKANGAGAYVEALRHARGYFHWLADRARTRFDLHTPEGRVAAFQFLLPAIQKMPDKLDRLAVANDVAEYLQMEPGIVLDEFRKAAAETRQSDPARGEHARRQRGPAAPRPSGQPRSPRPDRPRVAWAHRSNKVPFRPYIRGDPPVDRRRPGPVVLLGGCPIVGTGPRTIGFACVCR
ncbi:MAG: toprim domain-containing protein [Paludibaculum sp.]